MRLKGLLLGLLMMVTAVNAGAQHLFDYSDIKAGRFAAKSVHGVRSMADGEHYTVLEDGKRIVKYSYKTGQAAGVIFDIERFGDLGSGFVGYEFSADEKKVLIKLKSQPLYRHSAFTDCRIYDVEKSSVHRLTDLGMVQEATFSPQGDRVAFVYENNLYCVELRDYSLRKLTSDGVWNSVINGHTDWVYEEEFGFSRAFWFSPDGNSVAYLRFDESKVKEYTMMMTRQGLYPEPYTYKYPKAGEENSVVELYTYDLREDKRVRVDVGSEKEQYISRVGWTPESDLFFYRTNRLQNKFELMLANGSTGASRVVFTESDKRYIERLDDETVTFLPKGRFMVKSERSGHMHLYVHDMNKGGAVVDTVTRGRWDVTKLVDVVGNTVYYMSAEESPMRRSLYSVRLNGKKKTRLTLDSGVYSVMPSRGFKYFISYFSNATTPNLVRLHDGGGKVLRTLEDNAALRAKIEEVRLPRKEFFTFTTVRGDQLNGYMIKPADFSESKRYPVLMTQYSGPGSQRVLDRWTIDWEDVLVQEGYIVVCVDGRGTGGRGADFKKCTYGDLGHKEVEDQIEAAKYLSTLSYVDGGRIGIYGWSYGGFMALNCILKGDGLFKMAIAVAPVTSWRFYDTIYTEIYNGLPKDNPEGYDRNSPINYAYQLKGKLLMIHGTGDDNVHIQNAYRMASALVKADKKFDMMIYVDDNHGMLPNGRHHIREKMIDYTLENL